MTGQLIATDNGHQDTLIGVIFEMFSYDEIIQMKDSVRDIIVYLKHHFEDKE